MALDRYLRIWCSECKSIEPIIIDEISADDKNDHDAVDLMCWSCRLVIATIHANPVTPANGVMILSRDITKTECPWLDGDLPKGLRVYEYRGCTYGCVGAGIAVTREPNATPFFEIPRNAVSPADPT